MQVVLGFSVGKGIKGIIVNSQYSDLWKWAHDLI